MQNCPACAKEFLSPELLGQHRGGCRNNKAAYRCWLETCERSFAQVAHLANHRLLHVDERRNLCQACLARFSAPESLSLHLKLMHAQVNLQSSKF